MSDSDNEVLYLGTRRCRPRLALAAPISSISSGSPNDLRHRARDKPSQASTQRARIRTRSKSSHKLPVVVRTRKQYVELGWVHGWGKRGPPPVVFGFFDGAGRLCRRVGCEGPDPSMETPSSVPIAHRDVEYHLRFQGMSHRQIREEVLRRLNRKFGANLGPGEI